MTPRERIDALLAAEGIVLTRVAPAAALPQARIAATTALDSGYLDGMDWITAAWLSRSTDATQFLPGARSVILVALPCHSPDPVPPGDGVTRGRIARYARGRDYHRVFEKALRRVAKQIRQEFDAGARPTVDYGPLLERSYAATAGLGWLGKSTMLLVPGLGPWVLLGAIATTVDLPPDAPLLKSCGSCVRCIVACPTGAIDSRGNVLDARRCISYHTIENRGPIPRELRARFGDWIFGCDLCLDACPVGRSRFDTHPDFTPSNIEAAFPVLRDLLLLDDDAFSAMFRGRPIMRAKRDGLLRNVCVALGNVGTLDDVPALERALADRSPLVRGHAAWALSNLAGRLGNPDAVRARLANHVDADAFVRDEVAAALNALPG